MLSIVDHDDAAGAWYARCRTLSEDQGRHEDALRLGLRALAELDGRAAARPTALLMYSVASDLCALGRWEESEEACAALAARFATTTDGEVAALVDCALDMQAYVLIVQRRYAEALAAAEAGVAWGHDEASALRRKATALRGLGRPDEAVAVLQDALVRFPGDADAAGAKAALADALVAAGRYDEALIAFDAYLAAPPDDRDEVSEALVKQGLLLMQAERLEEGLEAYARLLELLDGVEDFGLRVRRAVALWNTTEALARLGRLDEAGATDERLAAEVAGDAELIFSAMAAELGARDDPQARIVRAGILLKEATIQATLGDEERAVALVRELIAVHGDDELPDVRRIVATGRALIEDEDVL